MRICVISSVHPWDDPRIYHREIQGLRKKYEITLYGVGDFKRKETHNVSIIGLPNYHKRMGRLGNMMRLLVPSLFSKAQAIHFHDPELLPLGWFIGKVTRKKVIYDVHEDYEKAILSKFWIDEKKRAFIARWYRRLEIWLTRGIDGIITVTDEIAGKFPSDKVIQVRNYPLLVDRPAPAAQHQSMEDTITLIYAGALTRVRGIKELVLSLDWLPKDKLRLILVGEFDEEAFEEEVRDLAQSRKVTLTGKVPYHEVYDYLEQADIGLVCLHPREQYLESLPIKMFEYMSAGLPVVASHFPLWKKIVEGEGCGITVNPLEPQDIARGIQGLIENKAAMVQMGKRGREAYQSRYNWQAEEKKLLDFYGRILS